MTLTPGARKLLLTAHLVVSVGWIGAVIAYIALDITAASSRDVAAVRAAYLAMEVLALYTIVPLSLIALVTGIVISLGTAWGLFRHYWVVISLALTILAVSVLLVETRTIREMAAIARSDADPRQLPGTLVHSVGGLLILLLITVLNVYKPRGLTRYGWRKQQKQRALVPDRS